MERSVYTYLLKRPDLLHFVRMNPEWYRLLSRNPEHVLSIESYAKVFYGKTFPQRVEQINQQLSMLNMLLSVGQMMKQPSS
ncbi:MAG: hypothetical protein H0Z32_02775 [Bacillaceae bacterium]|nr:hypothetical protein [Bacillaceae bacterium]